MSETLIWDTYAQYIVSDLNRNLLEKVKQFQSDNFVNGYFMCQLLGLPQEEGCVDEHNLLLDHIFHDQTSFVIIDTTTDEIVATAIIKTMTKEMRHWTAIVLVTTSPVLNLLLTVTRELLRMAEDRLNEYSGSMHIFEWCTPLQMETLEEESREKFGERMDPIKKSELEQEMALQQQLMNEKQDIEENISDHREDESDDESNITESITAEEEQEEELLSHAQMLFYGAYRVAQSMKQPLVTYVGFTPRDHVEALLAGFEPISQIFYQNYQIGGKQVIPITDKGGMYAILFIKEVPPYIPYEDMPPEYVIKAKK